MRDISALKHKQGEIHQNFSRLLHKSDFRTSDTIEPTILISKFFIISITKNFWIQVRDILALKNKQVDIHKNFS